MKKRISAVFAIAAVLALAAVACGGGGSKSQAPSGGSVGVTLKDFSISFAEPSVKTGQVTFAIKNDGPSLHEFVILQTDLAPTALPTHEEKGVKVADEESLKGMAEKEDIAPGTSTTLTVSLPPGNYVMICNIPGHYIQGMATGFSVSS